MEVIGDPIETASHEHLLNWTKSIKMYIKEVVQLSIRSESMKTGHWIDIVEALEDCQGRGEINPITCFRVHVRTLSQ